MVGWMYFCNWLEKTILWLDSSEYKQLLNTEKRRDFLIKLYLVYYDFLLTFSYVNTLLISALTDYRDHIG